MKINVISDLHLDFSDLTLPGGDVLILSGDICEARHLKRDMYNKDMVLLEHERKDQRPDRYYRFFEEECSKYREVIMVMGNHEHYGFQYQKTYPHIASQLPDNVTLLENQTHTIDDVVFVGATLWTDMNKEDPQTLFGIKGYMNDYRIIDNSNEVVHYKKSIYKKDEEGNYITEKVGEVNTTIVDHYEMDTRPGKFTPELSVVEHKLMLDTIKATVESNPDCKYVVIGHHAPSKLSTKPKYQKDVMVNGAYSSDLSEFILDHPQIKVWTHGHTHDVFDYMIGSTRIICNPRGYDAYEDRADKFELLFFEV